MYKRLSAVHFRLSHYKLQEPIMVHNSLRNIKVKWSVNNNNNKNQLSKDGNSEVEYNPTYRHAPQLKVTPVPTRGETCASTLPLADINATSSISWMYPSNHSGNHACSSKLR